MFECQEVETFVGCFCTLICPLKGQTEGTIVDDMGTEVVVQLSNGKQAIVYRDDLIVYD